MIATKWRGRTADSSGVMTTRHAICLMLTVLVLSGCTDREVSITETPLKVISETPGRGRRAEDGRIVHIDYDIKLPNGETVIKHKDWRFVLGGRTVVEGMEEAVRGMRVGGERVVECPPQKHWGRKGYADKIPPNTWLTFSIKLSRVE